MKITCVSDLHGHRPELPGGDVLIIAGDWTARDEAHEIISFALWVNEQNYKHKIIIAGNHDNTIQKNACILDGPPEFVMTYLCDSGVEINGYKFWGSPWTKTFEGMNPKCKAFTVDKEEELAEKFALIPDDVDILITHSPPHGILDQVKDYQIGKILSVGSTSLEEVLEDIKPKLHVFGHIHEAYGFDQMGSVIVVNSSHVNESYEPVNKPITIEL